jgi:hypothetical protein
MDEGRIDVDVTLKHPFPGLTMYTGFDVMGLFIHDEDTFGMYDSEVRWASGNGTAVLLNADGYSRWYNPVEFLAPNMLGFVEGALGTKGAVFNSTLNPYKYYCDGLGATNDVTAFFHDPANIAKRGLFSPAVNTRRYELQFPVIGGTPDLRFQYAVVASWETPEGSPPYDVPGSFPIAANQHEAFHIVVADNGSDLWYANGQGGGHARIRIEIFDWAAPSDPAGILGEFSHLIVESPDAPVGGGYVMFTPATLAPYMSAGTSVSSIVELDLDGFHALAPGDADFLITLQSKEGDSYDQGFGVPVPTAPLAAYMRFTLPVTGDNPCGGFDITGADPAAAESGQSYTGFKVLGTNFQDGANLAVTLMKGASTIASGTSVAWLDPGTISCDLSFVGVDPGAYDLRYTNGCIPLTYASIPYTVQLDCDNFSITNAVPGHGIESKSITGLAVNGEGFQNGTNLAVDIVDGAAVLVHGTSIAYVSSHKLTCNLDFTGAPIGQYQLRVTNGCDPISYNSIPFKIYANVSGPKNIPLAGGAYDFGVREPDGVALVTLTDGRIFVYTNNYSTGWQSGLIVVTQNKVSILDDGYGYLAAGPLASFNNSPLNPCLIKVSAGTTMLQGLISYAAPDQYATLDVTELDAPPINDWMMVWCWLHQSSGDLYRISSTIADAADMTNHRNTTLLDVIGTGPGKINYLAVRAVHASRTNSDPNYIMWVYVLEGSPNNVIERYDYGWDGLTQTLVYDKTICNGTIGNGDYQVYSPRDMSGDGEDRIYVLDLLINGQPIIKGYDKDGNYLGRFGDSTSIAGSPLRIDCNEGTGDVHVLHNGGVSIFTPADIPF